MRTHDHRITGPLFAITRCPHSPHQQLRFTTPNKCVVECHLRGPIELLPSANLPADSLDIKQLLGGHHALRLQTKIINVIVPPRMLATGSNENLAPCAPIFLKKLFGERFHLLGGAASRPSDCGVGQSSRSGSGASKRNSNQSSFPATG